MEKHVAIFSSSGSGLKFFSYFFAAVLLFQFLFEYSVDYEGSEACRKVGGNPVSPGKIHRSCINKQTTTIQAQIEGLNQAKTMCERMLESGNISFDDLQVEKYAADLETYWSNNKPVFKLDSVSFLYIWGSLITWAMITVLCFIIGILSYAKLPSEIPVQWNNGIATSVVDKKFIFVYPFACVCIRILLRPVIYVRFLMNYIYGELITEYLSNYLCFIALSVEVFSIMFVYGWIKSVVAVLLVDTVALIGILIVGITKVSLDHSPAFK